MSVAIIADAHLRGPGGAADAFLEQLESLSDLGCERLVLLGDIFHTWVALPRFETAENRRVVDMWRRLRADGLWIGYIEGNRDFFLRNSRGLLDGAFDFVGFELAFEQAGTKYLAVHGDGLNDQDRQYLAWRWLSKSPLVRLALATIPAALAARLMAGTERGLANTNFKHRRNLPEAAIRSFGRARLAEGHDVVLLGHFHEAHQWQEEEGRIRLVKPWFLDRHIEWLP